MNPEDVKAEVLQHTGGEREFRIIVSARAPRSIIVAKERGRLDLIYVPVVRAKFDEELAKETRPYRWRHRPLIEIRHDFDSDDTIFWLEGRGDYTDLHADLTTSEPKD